MIIVIVIGLIQNYLQKVIYICSTEDNRLHRLNEFHQWISQWAKAKENNKSKFLSSKLHFDLESMCLSFQSMVHYKSH